MLSKGIIFMQSMLMCAVEQHSRKSFREVVVMLRFDSLFWMKKSIMRVQGEHQPGEVRVYEYMCSVLT